jgi:hypothetical protein
MLKISRKILSGVRRKQISNLQFAGLIFEKKNVGDRLLRRGDTKTCALI